MHPCELVSVVIQLKVKEKTNIRTFMGRAVQQFCLNLLQSESNELSKGEHDYYHVNRYTVSGFCDREMKPIYGYFMPGECIWFRMSGLHYEISRVLSTIHEDGEVSIDRKNYKILRLCIDTEDHPWARQSTYNDLVIHHHRTNPNKYIDLDFVAPTAFKKQGLNYMFPDPSLVFGSLANRWIEFSNFLPPEHWELFVAYFVVVSEYQLASSFNDGYKHQTGQKGFQGTVTYSIVKNSRPFKRQHPEAYTEVMEEYHYYIRFLNLLADYAFFSGVGIKTSQGMGCVRRVL